MLAIFDTIRTMQVIQTSVSRGFTRYIGGTVRYNRALSLAQKFESRYGANSADYQSLVQRRHGIARCRLVMLPRMSELSFTWWLLVSADGAGPVVDLEHLVDAKARDHRIQLGSFELARLPAANRESRARWTWRLPAADFGDRLRYGQVIATHHSPAQAQAMVDHMATWPGYRGIAQQRREIWSAMSAARRDARRTDPLSIPSNTPWPRRLELVGHGTTLTVAVERMRFSLESGT